MNSLTAMANSMRPQAPAHLGGRTKTLMSSSNISNQVEHQAAIAPYHAQVGPMQLEREDMQKSVQLITIRGTEGSHQISLPGLYANFNQAVDVQNKPVKYNIHQVSISSQINNVFKSMAVELSADCVFLDTQTDTFITVSGNQFWLSANIVDMVEELNNAGIELEDSGTCKASDEYINDLQSNLTIWVQQQLVNAHEAGSYTNLFGGSIDSSTGTSFYALYECLMSSFFQFSQSTGKLQLVTRDINLYNLYEVTIDGVTYEAGRLFKQQVLVHVRTHGSNSSKDQFKVKRLLGMGRESTNTSQQTRVSLFSSQFNTGTEMSKWLTRTYDQQTIIFNASPQQYLPVVTSYDYYSLPCNALATNFVTIQTSLNTNQWKSSGQKDSNLQTVWLQKGFTEMNQLTVTDKHIHNEDIMQSFKNFRIDLYDEYGDIVKTNQPYQIDIAVHMKNLI